MKSHRDHTKLPSLVAVGFAALAAAFLVLGMGGSAAKANSPLPTKPAPAKHVPLANQVINSYPLTITVEDDTQMSIQYRDLGNQFFGGDAEGIYLWVNVGGVTKVFGPADVPAGNSANPYTFVSNTKSGTGSPSNPYLITTVADVPGTHLRLTQHTTYVSGAEFVGLTFSLQQIGATTPVTATLFHAADLYTGGSDQGYGYYDSSTGGVGDFYTTTNGITLYQEFVPNSSSPATHYEEHYWGTFWDLIGDTSGPGPGFDDTIDTSFHDSATGLQWNLTVPASGSVSVGDTDLFSPHASLCGSFSDVPYGSFYYDYIYYLACHGIVSGYSDTTFRPNNTATRGQLSKMVVLAEGWAIDTTGGPHFSDVPPSNPFYQYIETAYHHNAISGYSDGTFRWGNNVTRGQSCKIIVISSAWTIDTSGGPHFNDVPTTNPFYQYIETAYHHNIISGYSDGSFRWGNDVTRGQLSKILYLAITTAR